MTGIAPGLVTGDQVYMNTNGTPGMTGLSTPAGWATLWFILAVVYLVGVYWGMIDVG